MRKMNTAMLALIFVAVFLCLVCLAKDELNLGVAMGGLVIGLIFVCCYFLPTIIGRNKPQAGGIFIVNMFFGWTLVGWIAAFIWAFCGKDSIPYNQQKRCHGCGEMVLRQATVCRYCQTSFYHTLAEDQTRIPTLTEVIK